MSMTEDTPALQGTYADLALAYMSNGWQVLPVSGKYPPVEGATGRKGVINADKVELWRRTPETADMNIALRAHGWIGIDPDQYEDKRGADQLAELEEALGDLPVTISSTSRGKESRSRIYFYQVPEGIDFLSKAAPDIDIIQFSHRYALVHPSWHPSGEQYTWYDTDGEEMFDIPHVDDMERLPESWLEWLTVDPTKDHQGFSGSVEEWLDQCEQGEPDYKVQAWINRIPTENFDHTDVVKITFNLVRLGAERHPGIRQAMDHLFATWLVGEYADVKYKKELLVSIQGAIRKAGYPEPVEPGSDLPSYFDAMALLPQSVDTQQFLTGNDLRGMAVQLFQHLESERDVAAIVWKRAEKLGITDFGQVWDVVLDAQKARTDEPEQSNEFALIDDAERERIAGLKNHITDYLEYAENALPKGQFVPAYHRSCAWVSMGMTFGNYTFLDMEDGPRPTNIWAISPGPSGSGKSTSIKLLFNYLDGYYDDDKSYRFGTKGSQEGIHDKLVERDAQAALMADDEVAGSFDKWMTPNGDKTAAGMMESITQWHDGEVPPRQLVHRGGEKASWTTVTFCLLGFSTPTNLFESLSSEAFGTGFLARAVWDMADDSAKTEWQAPKFRRAGGKGDRKSSRDFAHEWGVQTAALVKENGTKWVDLEPEAVKRLKKAATRIKSSYKGKAHVEDIFEPSSTRLINTVMKCCALLASSQGRDRATVDDLLFVLSHAEHWLSSLHQVAKQASDGGFQRKKDRVLKFLRNRPATQVPLGDISELLGEEEMKVRQVIASLKIEDRLKEIPDGTRIMLELTEKGKKP